MRIAFFALTLVTAGCVQQAPQPRALPPAASNAPCTPEVLLQVGRQMQAYPEQCNNGDPLLVERYRLGFRITQVERELRAIDAEQHRRRTFQTPVVLGGRDISRDYDDGPFGSTDHLTIESARLRGELKSLKRRAGIAG